MAGRILSAENPGTVASPGVRLCQCLCDQRQNGDGDQNDGDAKGIHDRNE